jgi:hypothetical protein
MTLEVVWRGLATCPGGVKATFTTTTAPGHSMIFLGWDRDPTGAIVGIRDWSSQPWTDGIGESWTAIGPAADAFDPGQVYIARARYPR